MAGFVHARTGHKARRAGGLTEPVLVRVLLIGIALGFLLLFLVLPLATVFTEAFANGTAAYLDAIREPDALAALRLTVLAAGSCVFWVTLDLGARFFDARREHVLLAMR